MSQNRPVRLSAEPPTNNRDGLGPIYHALLLNRDDVQVVVGYVRPIGASDNFVTGVRVVETQWVAIEGVGDPGDRAIVEAVIARCRERRMGRDPNQLGLFPPVVDTPPVE